MADEGQIKAKFWKALASDRTMFLGLAGGEEGHARPMTAQTLHDGEGPIWFFTARDNALFQKIVEGAPAMAHFVAKGHDLWATLRGTLSKSTDRSMIDRLWNPFVAAWFGGKDDPRIGLIRLDADEAEIWIDASSFFAGVKMLIGIDPKRDYADKVATVSL